MEVMLWSPDILSKNYSSTLIIASVFSDHLSHYATKLGNLSQSTDFGDVTFHFRNGVRMKANKLILAGSSQLFGKLFQLNCDCSAWLPLSHDIICPGKS